MRLVQQHFQFIQFLVFLRIPFVAEQNHLDNLLAVLLQMGLQCALEIGRLYPSHIILLGKQFVVFASLLHIDLHIRWYLYQVVASLTIIFLIVIAEDIIDVLVLNPFLWQIVFVTDRQRQFVFNGINKDSVTQNVAIKCQ